MAGPSNVIELVFKLKDQATRPLEELRSKIGEIARFGAGVAGIAGFIESLRKTVEVAAEAELAMVKFDLAFKNLGATSGKTADELKRFAEENGKTSIFDSQSVLKAETALLRFRTVSGQTFDRARQDALDLASAMGTDLVSAAELVGRAIERPEIALRQLRQAGVTFTTQQEKLIHGLVETGQRAAAANIVLGELEKRFRGASDVIANTLSGAITRAKHGFDSLFEIDTGGMKQAFNDLADDLNKPEVKQGIQVIIAGLAEIVSLATRGAAFVGRIGIGLANAASGGLGDNEQVNADQRVLDLQGQIANLKNNSLRRIDPSGDDKKRSDAQLAALEAQLKAAQAYYGEVSAGAGDAATAAAKANAAIAGGDVAASFADLSEIVVKSFKVSSDATADFYRQLDVDTQTSFEKQGAQLDEFAAKLDEFYQHRLDQINSEVAFAAITEAQGYDARVKLAQEYNKRLKVATEDGLDEVKVAVKKEFIPAIKTPFDTLVDEVGTALDRMLSNGRFSFRELGQYLLREVLSGAIKKALDALSSAIKKAFANSGSSGSSSGGGNGGFFAAIGNAVGSYFGGHAAGGWGSGMKWVGEDGPELVNMGAGAMTYNRRMLAGLGGGGTSIDNRVSVVVQGNADKKELEGVVSYLEVRLAQSETRTLRLLQRNGLRRPV